MRLLDRYILRHFALAYAICFVSFVSLYIIIDLFSRIDEFTEHSSGVVEFGRNLAIYYGYRVPWFFQRLSGLLCLLAALFTLAWLERQNEIVAWLAAGVPGRRLLYPLVLGTAAITGLALLNREFVVPLCSVHLQRTPDDPFGRKQVLAQGAYDANHIHVTGGAAQPTRQAIEIGHITLPAEVMGGLVHLRCAELVYRPRSRTDTNGWFLIGAKPEHVECPHPALNWLGPGTYFLHTELSFERLTRKPDWFYYEPTGALLSHVAAGEQIQRRGELIALVHRRFTTPLWELLLVLMSLAWMAGRQDRHLIWKLGGVLGLNIIVQSVQLVCLGLAQQGYVDALLANWLPVLALGPAVVALWDAMRT